jgi:predicted enzyme related to lactoylglutathione lyase
MEIKEFRVALTTDDFERVKRFYRDGLGLIRATCGQVMGKVRYSGLAALLWKSLIRNTLQV